LPTALHLLLDVARDAGDLDLAEEVAGDPSSRA
jgi:hypothetical protein